MIEFENIILNNKQFLARLEEDLNGNSFLIESQDEVFLNNFAYEFAKYLLCSGEKKPCGSCLNCQKVTLLSHPDMLVYPTEHKNILTEDIKDLIENIYLSPLETDKKVYILQNFSSANMSAQNKLLKILEEPPKNVFIILCVTNISKVLPTIISRTQRTRLNPLSDSDIKRCLDSLNVSSDDTILSLSGGNLTKAISHAGDEDFASMYKAVLSCIVDMKSSQELIKYSYNLSVFKGQTATILEIFESFYRDMLLLLLDKEELARNKKLLPELKKVLPSYNGDSIDLIIKRIYEVKKQLDFNCNSSLLLDNFLLYILEVKFLCSK